MVEEKLSKVLVCLCPHLKPQWYSKFPACVDIWTPEPVIIGAFLSCTSIYIADSEAWIISCMVLIEIFIII